MRVSGEETSRNLRAYPRRCPRRHMNKINTSLISNRGKQYQTRKLPHSNLFLKNIAHDRKVLLSSFHLNSHTLGFHPQTQKLKPPRTA